MFCAHGTQKRKMPLLGLSNGISMTCSNGKGSPFPVLPPVEA